MVGVLGWEHSASKFLLDTCRIVSGITPPTVFWCLSQSGVDSTKLPAMVLAWENFQEVFVTVFLLHERFFIHCFSTSCLTLPWVIARFLHPFYTFSPAHRKVIRDTFILTFLGFSLKAGIFYPWAFFTPHFFTFCDDLWLRCGQEHSIQDLPLCFPSQGRLFRLTHGHELLMFEL